MSMRIVKGNAQNPDGGLHKIGTPSDKHWNDGFFDTWDKDVTVSDALDAISEAFLDLAPAKADVLTGKNLIIGTTIYSGKISDGLVPGWYQDGKVAGSTINSYIVVSQLSLATPNQSNTFRCGKKATPSTYGILELIKDSLSFSTYDVRALTIGSNGTINVSSIDTYNSMWSKANATMGIILSQEGYHSYILTHTEAGSTNETKVWYDNFPGPLSFAVNPAILLDTEVIKYLSGIQYLNLGTKINMSYKASSGIFKKVYHATNVSKILCPAVNTVTVNPSTVPIYTDEFNVNTLITLDIPNVANNNPIATVELYRPEQSINRTIPVPKRICTYGIVSTVTTEYFFDEDKRLVLDTNTAFDSVPALVNGNVQVRNGSLVYGEVDYTSKSGNQEYQRKFTKVSASTGVLKFDGINASSIAPYGTGNLNVLIQLDTDGKFFDLGKDTGAINGNGSGNSRENSIGGKYTINGSNLEWSIGTYTTATQGHTFRVIIIFRNNTCTITKITSS